MATHRLPVAELQDALGLSDDDVPYDMSIRDEDIVVETADAGERPPETVFCGFRKNGYTTRVRYLPASNTVRLSHTGPSFSQNVSLDEFRSMLRRDRVLSDMQYDRALLYVERQWERPTCDECGKLLLPREVEKFRQVRSDYPEVTALLCRNHQELLYDLMEYNPWEDEYVPGGNNEVEVNAE